MTDNKDNQSTETGGAAATTSNYGIDELVNIVNNHLNPVIPTSPTVSSTIGSIRTHSPPLMGTSARAAKRRMDSDSGPARSEEDQQKQSQTTNEETPPESRHSFSAKRDYFEQRFKTPPPTYDSPPARQQQAQKIITTITTTTTAAPVISHVHDRTSSSSNESPSVDRVLEQAVELQKMSNINSARTDSISPLVIERTEEYQVFLDAVNHEVRRTPTIARTSIVPATKTGHATDLDQAQAEVEHVTDDHEAIQQLTRALQEHNAATVNEYKRLPSQTSPPSPSSVLPAVLLDRTNLSAVSNEYSVIDALLNNPLGTIDDRYNSLLHIRYSDIITNLRNPEYLNSIKQPEKTDKQSKKKSKEKKSKDKTSVTTDTIESAANTPRRDTSRQKEKKSKDKKSIPADTAELAAVAPRLDTSQSSQTQITEQTNVTNTVLSEQTPLIDPKEKKKQDKENKKTTQNEIQRKI